ncbi:MAG: hypothetical protein ACUVXI_13280 [bacterium]
MISESKLDRSDIDILRGLAGRKAKIAQDPTNLERKMLWYKHDMGKDGRPMVLAEIQGVLDEVLPDSALECKDPWARKIERGLRMEIYNFDVLKDDHVVEPYINTNWKVETSNYGVEATVYRPENEGKLGARRWDPPIKDLDKDFDLLHPRTYTVDRESSLAEKEHLTGIFRDILPVRIRGSFWWTMGMTWTAIDLIGLENLMLSMYDNPEGLHRLMKFIHDDFLAFADWLEREGLLSLNNENDYIGSGSMGYTRDLPQPDWREGDSVRKRDLWVLLESQETVGVGPDLFEEFIFPYQLDIAKRFGKCYYGCCEPVHSRWHILKRIPNLARVSVSPWADEEFMADALGGDYVYSRKPNPTLVSTSHFDEDAIREDIRKTLTVARDCRVEIIMKDVHTLKNEPERLARWVEIAREEIAHMCEG